MAKDALNGTLAPLGIDGHLEKFIVIVVPDQHYMGTGEGIASFTGKERVDAIIAKHGGVLPVPLENIILLSADGLDAMVARVERGDFTPLEFLRQFREKQKDVKTRVMVPEQAVLDGIDPPLPSYLMQADEEWQRLAVATYDTGQ